MEDREDYLKKMAGIRAEWIKPESSELVAPLQNSIEIGESTKGLQVKSIKRYFGSYEEDWKYAIQQIFAMYDEAQKLIRERS